MSAFADHHSIIRDYDSRSLQHERRMLLAYRKEASTDAALLQPLANALWRAACFEWALYGEVETVRRYWSESARVLTEGFARRRGGFDPNPDQLILALHFAIAAREGEAFTQLALIAPNLRAGTLREARAFSNSRSHFHLAEGYIAVARSLVERKPELSQRAAESLDAAREECDRGWWERQFPDALDAAWRTSEHLAVCALLSAIADKIAAHGDIVIEEAESSKRAAAEFAAAIDETLQRLDKFIESDTNHHPKLRLWLPGLALCALAASAGLPMDWLRERHEAKADGYARLPPELLRNKPAAD